MFSSKKTISTFISRSPVEFVAGSDGQAVDKVRLAVNVPKVGQIYLKPGGHGATVFTN